MNFALWNAHSVCEFIIDNKSDESAVLSDLVPQGFPIQHNHRSQGTGGGVAIIHKDSLKMQSSECQNFKSFEFVERKFISRSSSFNFVVVYRPQYVVDFIYAN